MTPNPAMGFPLFPPIEIEIPDLPNYQRIQEELRLHKLSDAAWKANLEAALKSHGIFLQPSSPASTIALSVAEHAFTSLVPQIVSVQSLSPAQWASRREKDAVSVRGGEGEDILERGRDHDHDSNHSEGQARENEPVRDRPAARSSIASSAARRLAPGAASSSEDLILSDMPSSFGVSDSEHDIDISEIFQYPPPEPEPENQNSENEDDNELILPDTPQTSLATEGSIPLPVTAGSTPRSEAAALKAKIMAGNYPDVSIRAISGFPSSTAAGETEDIDLGDETQNSIDGVGVRKNVVNHITILPSEPLTLKDAGRNIGQMLSSPSLLSRSQNNSSDGESGLVRRNPTTAHLIQSALSSPPESTHDIWNNMLDGMLHRPHGNESSSPSSMFFPIRKVSPSSIPQTPSSARSNNNSIIGTPTGRTMTTTTEATASTSTTTSPHNVSSSSASSRRRLIFRNSLKSVQSRLRNSVSKKGFTYANNITAAVTAAAVARSRNRQQDIEDSTPGYRKDQLEAQNHIETISQRCRNGSHRKIYRCTLCNYSGPRDKTVLMHIRMVHIGTDRRHPCPHCQFRFKSSSHLRKHIQRKHSEASTNGYGSRLTKNEVDLDLSKFEEGEENPSDDGEDPLRDDGLNMNYGNNDGNDENPDPNAHEDFQIREAWELIHDNDMKPRYLCLFCDSVYNDEDTVFGHILSSHKCRNCGETFQLQETLQEHQEFSCLATLNNDSGNFNPNALSVSRSRGQGSRGTKNPNPNPRKRSRSDTDKLNTLGKKKKKRNNTLQYSFTEPMKHFLDPKILHVKNPKPPYICTLCDLTLNSTRQSARLHVRNVHFKNVKWLFQNQC